MPGYSVNVFIFFITDTSNLVQQIGQCLACISMLVTFLTAYTQKANTANNIQIVAITVSHCK